MFFVLFVQQENWLETEAPLSPRGTKILHLDGSFLKSLPAQKWGSLSKPGGSAAGNYSWAPTAQGKTFFPARAAADGSLERSSEESKPKQQVAAQQS